MHMARRRKLAAGALAALTGLAIAPAGVVAQDDSSRTLDGSRNNLAHPTWGKAGVQYRRLAPANYADGRARPVAPAAPDRYVSNRIFNDGAQNLFSENGVSQWGFAWGQFMDHTFGLRATAGGESQPLPFDRRDELEVFTNDLGAIDFARTPAAPGTGATNARQQINTIDSYIDGSSVYGNSADRLEWLRDGPVDGTMSNNSARLLLPDGLLPRRGARGNPGAAPPTDLIGRLQATPDDAVVAGDVRANENIGLQATHLLFAREHNRIVDALPPSLSEEEKFNIARRVVGAEQQFITYREFLPALGVNLRRYGGYDANVDATLTNEFAALGYRAHSMIHGEFEPAGEVADYTAQELESIESRGVAVEIVGDEVEFVVPLNVAFGNPNLMGEIGIGPIMRGLGAEAQYKNDEQIDNQLRSVLFQVPKPGVPDPSVCLDGPPLPDCFSGMLDLGSLDIARGRDHGLPSYNDLRSLLRPAGEDLVHSDHRRGHGVLPARPENQEFAADRRSRHPRLRRAAGSERQRDPARHRGGGQRCGRRRPPYHVGGAAEGDLRVGVQRRRVYRDAGRGARARHGVRRATARDLEARVREPARRRQVLLWQRSRAAADPLAVRNRPSPHSGADHP